MGLVHALRSSAEAAAGDDDGPLRVSAPRDGVRGLRAAQRSLDLLEMLEHKTRGNLGEAERDTLWTALRAVRARLERLREAVSTDRDADGRRVVLPIADADGERDA
jgi:hypothetical protein